MLVDCLVETDDHGRIEDVAWSDMLGWFDQHVHAVVTTGPVRTEVVIWSLISRRRTDSPVSSGADSAKWNVLLGCDELL